MDEVHEVRAFAQVPRDRILLAALGLAVSSLLASLFAASPITERGPRLPSGPCADQPGDDFCEAALAEELRVRHLHIAAFGATGLAVLTSASALLSVGRWVARRPREIVLTPYQVRIGEQSHPWEDVAYSAWGAFPPHVMLRSGVLYGVDGDHRLTLADEDRLTQATRVALARIAGAAPLDGAALEAVSHLADRGDRTP